MINLNESPIQVTNRHTVKLRAKVEAECSAQISFTDADVREWAGLGVADDVTQALIDDYAIEYENSFWDLDDIDDFRTVEVVTRRSEHVTVVPPEFVPLPGLDGDLSP